MDQKLLEILTQAQNLEEKIIPIYMKHLESAIFWTGLEKDKVSQAKKMLKRLEEDSKRHKVVVEKLIERIKEHA
jgi:rubrerythrin